MIKLQQNIYHYFASREDLLVSVFEMFSERSKQPLDYESFRKIYLDIRMDSATGGSQRAFVGNRPDTLS